MPTYTVHQAKTNLSKLLAEAEAGEEVIIARDDKPVVRLTPVAARKPTRKFGAYKGQFTVTDAFWEPMSEAELKEWYEGPIFPETPVQPSDAHGAATTESAVPTRKRRRAGRKA